MMIRRAKIAGTLALGILSILCILAQAGLFIYREALGSAFSNATEEQLYSVPPYISHMAHHGHGVVTLTIHYADEAAIARKGDNSVLPTPPIRLTLEPGRSRKYVNVDGKEHFVDFEYFPAHRYSGNSSSYSKEGVVILHRASLSLERPVVSRFAEWAPSHKENSKHAMHSVSENSPEKVITQLIKVVEGRRGVPSDTMSNATPDTLRNEVATGSSQFWCTQIALLTSASVGSTHIVRLVTSSGAVGGGNVLTGGHTFNEILDPLTGLWMLVDPTSYIVGVRWADGTPISAIQMRRLLALPSRAWTDNVVFYFWNRTTGSTDGSPWTSLPTRIQDDLALYFSPHNSLRYFTSRSALYEPSLLAKLSDWTRLDRRFKVGEIPGLGALAYTRVITFWLLLVAGPAFITLTLLWMRAHRKVKPTLFTTPSR